MKSAFKVSVVQIVAIVAVAGGVLAGCTAKPSSNAQPIIQPVVQPSSGAVKADQKVGNTTLSGTLTKVGGQYMLSQPGQPTKGLDSYKVDLSKYVGKSVKVTGQYSGDTLFISQIE